jgi:hypothetical protein
MKLAGLRSLTPTDFVPSGLRCGLQDLESLGGGQPPGVTCGAST